MANHPHKLPRDHYIGRRTHFLSACTHLRHVLFRSPATCALVTAQLMRASRKHWFVIIAYVLMPDHVHVLVEGTRDDSDFLKWLNLFRQLSGYWEKRRSGCELWQEGYWDYTLRDNDSVASIASYIVWNPVEAGLVGSATAKAIALKRDCRGQRGPSAAAFAGQRLRHLLVIRQPADLVLRRRAGPAAERAVEAADA
jgi:putative transposase